MQTSASASLTLVIEIWSSEASIRLEQLPPASSGFGLPAAKYCQRSRRGEQFELSLYCAAAT